MNTYTIENSIKTTMNDPEQDQLCPLSYLCLAQELNLFLHVQVFEKKKTQKQQRNFMT